MCKHDNIYTITSVLGRLVSTRFTSRKTTSMRLGFGRTAMVKHLAVHGRPEGAGQTTVAVRQQSRDQQHVIATNIHKQLPP